LGRAAARFSEYSLEIGIELVTEPFHFIELTANEFMVTIEYGQYDRLERAELGSQGAFDALAFELALQIRRRHFRGILLRSTSWSS
jgi:hypothetical protein